MRGLFILLCSIFISLNLMAQLEVKNGSFKEVTGFVNINTDIMFDDNDKPYAVLKVKTENINDKERRQLLFQGDARTFIECEYKVGEVWLYISYYATYIKISHPDFGSTEFWFPFDMQGKKGYELTLINKPSLEEDFLKRLEALENATASGNGIGEYGYVVIRTTPVNSATVLIDGEEMDLKTPFVSDKLSLGHHRIRVVKEHYKPYVTVVEIENGKTLNLDVNLEQAYGNLEIVTQPEKVNIKLNMVDKGTTPNLLSNIQTGSYKLELSKKKYKTVIQDVVVKDGETTYVDIEMMKEGSFRTKGFLITPGVNVLYASYHNIPVLIIPHLHLEYMFGPNLGVGLGGGIIFAKANAIQISGQISYYFSNSKTSPFISAKIGYNSGISSYTPEGYTEEYECQLRKSIFELISIGINVNKSIFAISIGDYGFEYKSPWATSYNSLTIGISYHYMIPLGQKK